MKKLYRGSRKDQLITCNQNTAIVKAQKPLLTTSLLYADNSWSKFHRRVFFEAKMEVVNKSEIIWCHQKWINALVKIKLNISVYKARRVLSENSYSVTYLYATYFIIYVNVDTCMFICWLTFDQILF